jgi:hypothetical protein
MGGEGGGVGGDARQEREEKRTERRVECGLSRGFCVPMSRYIDNEGAVLSFYAFRYRILSVDHSSLEVRVYLAQAT